MSSILILGGTGSTGRLIAQHLLAHSNADVTIAARRLDRAQALADTLARQYPDRRVRAVHADASRAESLRRALAEQRMVVVAAPTTGYVENVARTCLDMGVDYLDIQLGANKLAVLQALAEDIKHRGCCFITEAGFHPGLPSALVRHAGAHLERMESAITLGYLNMGHDLPYSEAVDEVVESFKEYNGQIFTNGQWTKPRSYHVRTLDFGGDIGRRRCYSMLFEELRPLPQMFPSLRETGFYMSGTHWVVDWVVMPITWAWLKLIPKAVRPIGRFLWWGMGTFHKPPYRVELQVQAAGLRDGRPVTLRASVSHRDGYELTAIPVVATLLQYLDSSARKPGLWMMGHLIDPHRLIKDMEAMGVACSTRIQAEEVPHL